VCLWVTRHSIAVLRQRIYRRERVVDTEQPAPVSLIHHQPPTLTMIVLFMLPLVWSRSSIDSSAIPRCVFIHDSASLHSSKGVSGELLSLELVFTTVEDYSSHEAYVLRALWSRVRDPWKQAKGSRRNIFVCLGRVSGCMSATTHLLHWQILRCRLWLPHVAWLH
jgi:hypothetical protein